MLNFLFIAIMSIISVYAGAMDSDTAHKEKEVYMEELSFDNMKKLEHGEAVRWLITPKLRLTKNDLNTLKESNGILVDADGTRTIATLKAVEWKGGKPEEFTNNADILMEKVYYDPSPSKKSYMVIYRYPKDSADKDKSIKVQLSDIKVKDPESDIGKSLIFLISHPALTDKKESSKNVSQSIQIQEPSDQNLPAPLIIQQKPSQPVVVQQAAPPQTIIIEEVGHPYPYRHYNQDVVVGGWWGGHHRHW